MHCCGDKAGIGYPLGWPDEFVDFVVAHRTGQAVAPEDVAGRELSDLMR